MHIDPTGLHANSVRIQPIEQASSKASSARWTWPRRLATIHVPLTAIFLIAEITGGYALFVAQDRFRARVPGNEIPERSFHLWCIDCASGGCAMSANTISRSNTGTITNATGRNTCYDRYAELADDGSPSSNVGFTWAH
ncbi:MAG: hypothetical protein IPL77_16780 [Flavobacteriales bacterium]|nr:hypothetical protein [Flavobacteriales bacterium]